MCLGIYVCCVLVVLCLSLGCVFLFPMWLVLFGVACLRVVYWLLGYLVCVCLLGVLCMCLGCLLCGVVSLLVCCAWCFGCWSLAVWLWWVSGFGRVLFFWVLAWFCFLVGCWGFVFCWAVVCWFGWWFVFVGCLGGFCVLGVGGCVLFFWSYIICVDCGRALRVSACVGFLFSVTACFLGVCS